MAEIDTAVPWEGDEALNEFLQEYHAGLVERRAPHTQKMQAALARYLICYAAHPAPPPLHMRAAEILGNDLLALSRNESAPLFARAAKRGTKRSSPEIQEAQRAAVRYIRWCKEGRIVDPTPGATVDRCFALSTGTALKWARLHTEIDSMELFIPWDAQGVVSMMHAYGIKYPFLPGVQTNKGVRNRDPRKK
jgi:hypothetical protein